MLAHIYFRRNGETNYLDLGIQEMNDLPPKGGYARLRVDGDETQVRVVSRREFLSRKRRPPRPPTLFVEAT